MMWSRDGAMAVTLVAIASLCCLPLGAEAFAAAVTVQPSGSAFHVAGRRVSGVVRDGRAVAGSGAVRARPGAGSGATIRRGDHSLRMITLEVVSDEDIPETAEFFVSNFWEEDLGPSQKRPLVRELVTDYRRRYGTLMGKRLLPSMLVAARDSKKEIVGCIAVELSVCKGELVGVKARGLSQWADDTELRPVVANLAVGRAARRKGLAKRLVKKCEDTVKEWGYGEVLLLVEENNTRAKKLYQKLGYKMLFRDTEAKKILPDSYQIRDVSCVNVCMRRDLNANIFSNLFQMILQN